MLGYVLGRRHCCAGIIQACCAAQGVCIGSLPKRLLLLFVCMCSCLILRGDRGRSEKPCPTKLPHPIPGHVATFACSWIPARIACGHHFVFIYVISCRAILNVWLSTQDPCPNVLLSRCFCRYAIPSVWRTYGIKMFTHFSCMFDCVSWSYLEFKA